MVSVLPVNRLNPTFSAQAPIQKINVPGKGEYVFLEMSRNEAYLYMQALSKAFQHPVVLQDNPRVPDLSLQNPLMGIRHRILDETPPTGIQILRKGQFLIKPLDKKPIPVTFILATLQFPASRQYRAHERHFLYLKTPQKEIRIDLYCFDLKKERDEIVSYHRSFLHECRTFSTDVYILDHKKQLCVHINKGNEPNFSDQKEYALQEDLLHTLISFIQTLFLKFDHPLEQKAAERLERQNFRRKGRLKDATGDAQESAGEI